MRGVDSCVAIGFSNSGRELLLRLGKELLLWLRVGDNYYVGENVEELLLRLCEWWWMK